MEKVFWTYLHVRALFMYKLMQNAFSMIVPIPVPICFPLWQSEAVHLVGQTLLQINCPFTCDEWSSSFCGSGISFKLCSSMSIIISCLIGRTTFELPWPHVVGSRQRGFLFPRSYTTEWPSWPNDKISIVQVSIVRAFQDFFQYERCSFPQFIFDNHVWMRIGDKTEIIHHFI